MFAGSHHQSFENTDFRVAGRDFINPIVAPTISPAITVNVTTSAPATGSALYAGDGMDWNALNRPQHTGFPNPSSPNPRLQTPEGQSSPPRAASEPSPQKVHDPRRLSQMLGSLRRLIKGPKSSNTSKRSRRRDSGTPDDERSASSSKSDTQSKTLRHKPSWSSDASAGSCSSDVTVSSIDEPDDWAMKPPKMTTPDVYVSRMLKSGKGLACWQPRPRKPNGDEFAYGTIPGDVGTFTSEGGFKKIFNIWDDDLSVRKTAKISDAGAGYQLPPRSIIISRSALGEGDTVVQGATAKTLYGDDNKTIACFEFRCRAQQGAILAVTSPAKLEELADHTRLKDHIFQHADLIYRHADKAYRLADDEPLYIITGCIKSESWALAAFNDSATLPGDTITLMKMGHHYDQYAWTDRGTAEAYVGRTNSSGMKNQNLFLRGFKLAFSRQFLHRMRAGRPPSVLSIKQAPTSSPSLEHGTDSWFDHDAARIQTNEDDSHISTFDGANGNVSASGHHSRDIQIQSIAEPTHKLSSHPCDIINQYILDNTEADFALSHDDDWYFLLDDPLWDGGITLFFSLDIVCSDPHRAIGDLISVRKGEKSPFLLYDHSSPSAKGVAFMADTTVSVQDDPWDEPVYFSRFYASLGVHAKFSLPVKSFATSKSDLSQSQFEPEQQLRANLGIQPGETLNLWSLPCAKPGERPPHSYPVLVWLAVNGSANRRMTLNQIFTAIEERFEFYRNQPKGCWKGTIRHNLILNQVFKKERAPSEPNSDARLPGVKTATRSEITLAILKRRKAVHDLYRNLRDELPQDGCRVKATKEEILKGAIEYISYLKEQGRRLLQEEAHALLCEQEASSRVSIPPVLPNLNSDSNSCSTSCEGGNIVLSGEGSASPLPLPETKPSSQPVDTRALYKELREQMPQIVETKPSKWMILMKAVEYISQLKMENQRLLEVAGTLRRETRSP
ncbi:hypothetical protein NMY22_g12543 [Coprinellus aureogranulatus]|nr:hypothetical protein NMY22_g12543 [Coprinellus aureogranulatus]